MESMTVSPCRLELDLGIESSRDPVNAFLPDLTLRTTTIYSPWYTRTCPGCRHKFREGDRVRVCPGTAGKPCGQAYHDDTHFNLRCWQSHFRDGHVCKESGFDRFANEHVEGCGYTWSGGFPDEETTCPAVATDSKRNEALVRQFEIGLMSTWRAFGARHVLVAKPGDSFIGHNCPWCRFQIRAGDHIIKCPCGKCQTYFHDDIFRHLECWNQWNGSQGQHFCPTTGSKISADTTEGSHE